MFVVCPSQLCSLSVYLTDLLCACCCTRWPSKHSRIPAVILAFLCSGQITHLHPLSTWWRCLSTLPPVSLRERIVGNLIFLTFPFYFPCDRLIVYWCVFVCLHVECVFPFLLYNEYIFCFWDSAIAVMNSRRLFVVLFCQSYFTVDQVAWSPCHMVILKELFDKLNLFIQKHCYNST